MADRADDEDAILLGNDEIITDKYSHLAAKPEVTPVGFPPVMTRADFEMMKEQNQRILLELTRLKKSKRKRSKSRSRSQKRVKGTLAEVGSVLSLSDSDRDSKMRDDNGTSSEVDNEIPNGQNADVRSLISDANTEKDKPENLIQDLIAKCQKAKNVKETSRPSLEQDHNEDRPSAQKVLDRLQKDLEANSEEGPNVDENLIKILEKMNEKINLRKDKEMKELNEKIKRPANWQATVPRVNVEAWQSIDYQTKEHDLLLQKRQGLLLKNAYKLAYLCDQCMQSSHEPMINMIEDLMEALQMIMKSVHDISLERRRKILNSTGVNRKYRNPLYDLPVTDLLFGPDMKAFMNQCESTEKLGRHFTVSTRGRKFFPKNGHARDQYQQGENWRGRGRGHWNQTRNSGPFRGRGGTHPSRPSRGRY